MTAARDPMNYAWWLTARAAGVTAFALASLAVVLGLAMAGRLSQRPGMARALRSAHQHAALGALLAIAVHAVALLADPWMHAGLTGITVPLALAYRPAATALGIVAAYGAALLGLTFYLRRRIGPRLWRRAHRLTIVVWAMAAVHALAAGTDATTPWMRGILVGTGVPIAVLFALRVTERRRRPTRRTVLAGETLF
jgi:sulfoxide reductase heme-binding subunit YedZ